MALVLLPHHYFTWWPHVYYRSKKVRKYQEGEWFRGVMSTPSLMKFRLLVSMLFSL